MKFYKYKNCYLKLKHEVNDPKYKEVSQEEFDEHSRRIAQKIADGMKRVKSEDRV